jgi:two-component system sensor histidine kinase UhpB
VAALPVRDHVTAVVVVLQMGLIVALLLGPTSAGARRDARQWRPRATEQVRDLAGQLITAQEAERARIARELHDDIGQRIAAFSISISSLKRQAVIQTTGKGCARKSLPARRTIDLSECVRHLSHDLHPATLQHAGIASVLRATAKSLAARQRGGGERRPGARRDRCDVALCLFRVTQEALQNIARHASARHVQVSLTRSATNVELSIADDGAGFDPERAHLAGGGLGLQSIRERVRMARGRLMIDSAPGRGTTVWVSVAASDPEGRALSRVVWRRDRTEETRGRYSVASPEED